MDLIPFYITTIITIIFAFAIYIKWLLRYWKRKGIPYLQPSFPFGNLGNPITKRQPLGIYFYDFYRKLKQNGATKYGGIYIFWSPVLIVLDPDCIKQILTKEFQNFHERGFYYNKERQPISANLFTIDGDKWRTLRTKFTPTFTSAKMKIMFDIMVNETKLLNEYIHEHVVAGKALNARDCLGRVTANIIGTCAFGIECNSFKDTTFRDMIKEVLDVSTSFFKVSFCNTMPTLAKALGIVPIPKKHADYVIGSIDEAIDVRKKSKIAGKDFLQLVMEMEEQNIITMDELRAQCLLFFAAGFESTRNTLVFLLFELTYNPDIQRKLREEVTRTLDEHKGVMSYEAIMGMRYLDMVLNETLRKYSPIAFLNRRCPERVTLPNSDVIVEKGTKFIIPTYALHHDPEYFSDPQNFDPERFSEENKGKIFPYTYLGFGEGPRNCIGDRFAKQEMKTTIVSLMKRFKFKLHKQVKVPLIFSPSGTFITAAEEILFDVEEIS